MTPEQAKRIAELHASGASERQISADTGVPATSVHREIVEIKRRAAGQDVPEHQADEPEPSPAGEGCKSEPGQHDAEVLQAADEVLTDEAMVMLVAERDRLMAEVEKFTARVQASFVALGALEAERDQLLLDTGDPSPVRQRLADASADLANWTRGVELIAPQLDEVNARIAELGRVQELAVRRARIDAAVSAEREAYQASGPVVVNALTVSHALAQSVVDVYDAEQAATAERIAAVQAYAELALPLGEPVPAVPEPQSTWPSVRPSEAVGNGPRGLFQVRDAAVHRNVAGVAEGLGLANGYLPPGPASEAEIARGREWLAAMEKQAADAKAKAAYGIGPDGAGKVHDLDEHGNEIRYRQPHPQDIYRFPTGTGSYGSGFRTGW